MQLGEKEGGQRWTSAFLGWTVLTYAEQKFDEDSKKHGPRPDNEVMHTS